MFDHLQIYDPRERVMVGCADALLKGVARVWPRRPREVGTAPRRILVLRLERIGDLLMTLGAIEAIRQRAPHAAIHLVVGSWNASLAALLTTVDSFESLDVPWLARENTGASTTALVRAASRWRAERFDLALNLEPDIRSNLLLALSGASRRAGFRSGGGGALLTTALDYAATEHTAANTLRLVDAVLPANDIAGGNRHARLSVPAADVDEARRLLIAVEPGRPLIGIHASGGRQVKQWYPDRFAQVATRLARDLGAAIVLTGTPAERPLIATVLAAIPSDVTTIDVAGSMTLPVFAALLQRLDLFITGDTGPMHLAAAVGTPIVALFGPSSPARYGPLSDRVRVLTANLWCRPCNRVRQPPSRCASVVPDCLGALDVDLVEHAARELLDATSSATASSTAE